MLLTGAILRIDIEGRGGRKLQDKWKNGPRGKLRTIPYTANRPGASIYGGEKMTDKLQQLIDKDAIRDAMLRYARGVDRRDWEAVRDTFFEDGTDPMPSSEASATHSSTGSRACTPQFRNRRTFLATA